MAMVNVLTNTVEAIFLRPKLLASIVGSVLILMGTEFISSPFFHWSEVLGAYFLFTGLQILLWAAGIRIELFSTATSADAEDAERVERYLAYEIVHIKREIKHRETVLQLVKLRVQALQIQQQIVKERGVEQQIVKERGSLSSAEIQRQEESV